jgi:hypothetical protein
MRNAPCISWVIRGAENIEETIETSVLDESDVADQDLTQLARLGLPEGETMPTSNELLGVDVGGRLVGHGANYTTTSSCNEARAKVGSRPSGVYSIHRRRSALVLELCLRTMPPTPDELLRLACRLEPNAPPSARGQQEFITYLAFRPPVCPRGCGS